MKPDIKIHSFSMELGDHEHHFVSITKGTDALLIEQEDVDDLILELRKIQKPIRVESPVE